MVCHFRDRLAFRVPHDRRVRSRLVDALLRALDNVRRVLFDVADVPFFTPWSLCSDALWGGFDCGREGS